MGPEAPMGSSTGYTRRTLLKRTGGLALVAAAGAGVARAATQGVFSTGEGPAYIAWEDYWRKPPGDPVHPVRAAI